MTWNHILLLNDRQKIPQKRFLWCFSPGLLWSQFNSQYTLQHYKMKSSFNVYHPFVVALNSSYTPFTTCSLLSSLSDNTIIPGSLKLYYRSDSKTNAHLAVFLCVSVITAQTVPWDWSSICPRVSICSTRSFEFHWLMPRRMALFPSITSAGTHKNTHNAHI